MLTALALGSVASGALLLGALIGLYVPVPTRLVGLVMGFGVGVLMSAVAFELADEAVRIGGNDVFAVGIAAGALAFYAGNRALDRYGARHRKRSAGQQSSGAGLGLMLGSLLDGIPESAVVGLSLGGGGAVGVTVLAAVFLSNVPESLSASRGMRQAGYRPGRVLAMWTVVALVCTGAAGAGYALQSAASGAMVGTVQAFAAGAILVMLADTMVPEAVASAGRVTGIAVAFGFATSIMLTSVT